MNKLFLDSDVLLDLLLDREPFADDTAELIKIALSVGTKLCVSPISITNINYIIGRLANQKKADKKTKKILKLVEVENVGQQIINNAAKSKFKDFEDAVQNYCAEAADHKVIVTRNIKDYRTSDLSILTPKEYLATMQNM